MNNVLYLDVFSEETSFIVKGKKNFRTWFGVFLSVLLIIASFILTIMFGKEVYQRKKPSVSISEEFLDYSRVEMMDYPVFVNIIDYYGNNMANIDGYYEILTYKMNYTEEGEADYLAFTPNHPVVRCESKHFNAVRGKISESEIERIVGIPSFCIEYDKEGVIQNPYLAKNSTLLDIDVVMCDKAARKCADDFDVVVKEAYVQLYFVNAYLDSTDFENPVKYYYESITTQITDSFLKRNYISINNNQYISDDGWIIEETRVIPYYSVGKIKAEVNSKSPQEPLSVLWNTLQSPYLRTNTSRAYLKIQDLFAKIGGVVNAFMILIQILFVHYFRYNFNMNLRKHLNPSNEDYKERRSFNLNNISVNAAELNSKYYGNKIERSKINNNNNRSNNNNNNNNVANNTNSNNILQNHNLNNNYTTTQEYNTITDINKEPLVKCLNNNLIRNNLRTISIKKYNNPSTTITPLTNNYLQSIQNNRKNNDPSNTNKINKECNTLNTPYTLNTLNTANKIKSIIDKNDRNNNNTDKLEEKRIIITVTDDKSENINAPIKDIKENNNNLINQINSSNSNSPSLNNQNHSNTSDLDLSIFNFHYIDFSKLNYFKYLYNRLFCTRKLKVYDAIKNEIEHLLDFYVYCNYLKHQYLLNDPRELCE